MQTQTPFDLCQKCLLVSCSEIGLWTFRYVERFLRKILKRKHVRFLLSWILFSLPFSRTLLFKCESSISFTCFSIILSTSMSQNWTYNSSFAKMTSKYINGSLILESWKLWRPILYVPPTKSWGMTDRKLICNICLFVVFLTIFLWVVFAKDNNQKSLNFFIYLL